MGGSHHSVLKTGGSKLLGSLLHHLCLLLHNHSLLLSYHHLLLHHHSSVGVIHHAASSSKWLISLRKGIMSRLVLHGVRLHLLEHVYALDSCLLASEFRKQFGIISSLGFSLLDLHIQDSKLTFFLGNGIFFIVIRCELMVNLLIFLVVLRF